MRKLIAVLLSLTLVFAVASSATGATSKPKTKHVLVGDDLAFHPHKLKVKKGTKVVWKWQGGLVHNVVVTSGPVKFHSKAMMKGTYAHKFTTKGTYTLECTIHGFAMTVKVS